MDLTSVKNKITDYEKAITDHLKAQFPDFYIEDYVKSPKDFYLKHPKGAILVHYNGGKYSDSHSTDLIVQDRNLSFEMIVSMKHLQSDANIQDTMDGIRLVLTGFQPLDTQKMRPVSERFIAENQGTWIYGITFSIKASNIEIDRTDYEAQVPLTQVTAQAEGYEPVITTSEEI